MGNLQNPKGLTLVEILVAMAITGVVSAAIYSMFFAQNRTFIAQRQVVDTQQELRTAMALMAKEIRMAGYNDPFNPADARILTAEATLLRFSMDRSGGEADGIDNDGDGVVDNAEESAFSDGATDDRNEDVTFQLNGLNLVRTTSDGTRPLIDRVENIEFNYQVDAPGGPVWNTAPAADQLDDIRMVQVTILARTDREDPAFSSSGPYITPSGADWTPVAADGFRRRLLTTSVRCRNMGL